MPAGSIAVAYCRASHQNQITDGNTIPRQLDRIKEYARQNGIGDLVVLKDEGLSGYKDKNRPAFQEMLRLCKTKQVTHVIVTSLDRASRSLVGTLKLFDEVLIPNNIIFVALDNQIDTATPAGRLVLSLIASFNEFYRADIQHKIRASMAHLRKKNQKTGGILPYGFSLASDGRSLVPCAEEQATLTLISEMRNNRASLRQIAAELQRRSILTRTGKTYWQSKVIKSLLDRMARDTTERADAEESFKAVETDPG